MRIGFVYNVRTGASGPVGDEEAEFDDPDAIAAIRAAISSHGHDVIDLEAGPTLPQALAVAQVDAVFNIAEGTGPRSREAQVPALLELLGIPYTGSDAVTLGITLDKSLAKTLVAAVGVVVPQGGVLATGDEPLVPPAPYPVIVKPLHEGSSKGIGASSIVADERALREMARELIARYEQPVLYEEYVRGREVTVGLLGTPPRILPPMEVVFLDDDPDPLYSFEAKKRFEELVRYEIPAPLTDDELGALEAASLAAFAALGCRDVARIDFRIDERGVPYFLECNPLPGLAPGFGDLTFIAAAAGISYEGLIGEILEGALARNVAHDARAG
jgi:D-alanine-D-alanine ligase